MNVECVLNRKLVISLNIQYRYLYTVIRAIVPYCYVNSRKCKVSIFMIEFSLNELLSI